MVQQTATNFISLSIWPIIAQNPRNWYYRAMVINISKQALQRMPYYLQHLKEMRDNGKVEVSAPYLAQQFGMTEIQVRKDLAAVSSVQGKPKVGFKISPLIVDIENLLGYKHTNKAILIGAGSLGHALMGYKGFDEFGIDIIAAFDANEDKVGEEINGKTVYSMKDLERFCNENPVQIGIMTVPAIAAQRVCDQLVSVGIKAIWNFAQLHLIVPSGILVQNENMAASLAMLFNHLNGV